MNNDIYVIEKAHFSNTHRNYSRFLNNINNKHLSKDTLKKIILLNKKMLEINNLLEDVNYNIDKKKNNLPEHMERELQDYEKNDKAISHFLPYIIYYRFLLETQNKQQPRAIEVPQVN